MVVGTWVLIAVLVVAGGVATLALGAAVVQRGGSRTSAIAFAVGWLLLAFIPVAWGIFGGRTAWYVQAVGAYDFAGAIPFHLGGGVGALAIALFIARGTVPAPRWRPQGPLQVTLALGAVAALWIGWLMLMELDLNRFIPTIATNSVILAGSSVIATLAAERLVARRTTVTGAVVGVLTGLAAATACSAFLEPVTSAVTGLLAGAIAGTCGFVRRPAGLTLAGVIAVTNLVGGTTGLLMTGLLEPSRGFFYSGSVALPVAQVTAVIVCVVYCTLVCVPLGLVIGGRHRKRTVSAPSAPAVTGTETAHPGLSGWAIPDSNR